MISILPHIAANVAPGTQLLDWYEPVDFTDSTGLSNGRRWPLSDS